MSDTANIVTKAFSLTCTGCDAGDGIDSQRQAELLGWQNIVEDDGPSWNYLGLCPQCFTEEESK